MRVVVLLTPVLTLLLESHHARGRRCSGRRYSRDHGRHAKGIPARTVTRIFTTRADRLQPMESM